MAYTKPTPLSHDLTGGDGGISCCTSSLPGEEALSSQSEPLECLGLGLGLGLGEDLGDA